MKLGRLFLFAVSASFAFPAAAHAAWSSQGLAVAWAAEQQIYPVITSDGAGGAIIAWQDGRTGDFNIYAQRVNQNGVAMWLPNGVALCTAANDQSAPQIISDGAGGAIITWFDFRNGSDNNIYAQRINSSGLPQWTANGVAVCTAADDQANVIMAPDGSGGAVLAWDDNRNGTDYNTYVQRLNSSGAPQYTADGVVACAATGNQFVTALVPNGAGAAIVVWYDSRGADSDVYAQRVNSLGGVSWAADGVALSATTGDQDSPNATSDGSGGAIVAWEDLRGGLTYDIYAQHINSAGTLLWTVDGVSVCNAANNQSFPTVTTDDAGGAIVAWQDARNGSNAVDIYAQRLNGSGATQWTGNGVALCSAIANQDHPMLAADGSGGAIVVWNDARNGNPDIFAQRVNAAGAIQWTADGQPVVSAIAKQASPTLVSIAGGGGAIFTWQDFRDDIKGDIFASRLTGSGTVPTGVNGATPRFVALGDNRPNPFSSTTTFDLTLDEAAPVSVEIFDVAGRRVREIDMGHVGAGASLLQFDGLDAQSRALPSGVYFLRMRAGSEIVTRKMVIAR